MAIQRIEEELTKRGHGDLAEIIAGVRKEFARRNPDTPDVPLRSIVTPALKEPEAIIMYPEISLEQEWQRQIQRFIELGFHTKLSKTEAEYAQRFPKFTRQPEIFAGGMDTPVLIETEISLKDQCGLAGIVYALDSGHLTKKDWNQNLKGYTPPEAPYAAWLDDGRNSPNKKAEDVRKNLTANQLAGTALEGIALYISNPKILEDYSLSLPGTSVGRDFFACLHLLNGQPKLHYELVSKELPLYSPVVRGR